MTPWVIYEDEKFRVVRRVDDAGWHYVVEKHGTDAMGATTFRELGALSERISPDSAHWLEALTVRLLRDWKAPA